MLPLLRAVVTWWHLAPSAGGRCCFDQIPWLLIFTVSLAILFLNISLFHKGGILRAVWELFKTAITVMNKIGFSRLNLIWVFNPVIIYKLKRILIYVIIANSKCVTNYIFSFHNHRAVFTRNI